VLHVKLIASWASYGEGMRVGDRIRDTSTMRTRGMWLAAVGLACAVASTACAEVSVPESKGPPDAWSPVGDTQREGVVRLVSAGNTANLEITIYRRRPGAQHVACERYVSPPNRPFILGVSVWPTNQHESFPALTLTFRSDGTTAEFTDAPSEPIDGACRPARSLSRRALDPKEQAAFLGVQPSQHLPRTIEVVVNGHHATVPLRPICQHGESQSVSGCVYDPVTWDMQPGFPSITL
jgi:hypothetical protein